MSSKEFQDGRSAKLNRPHSRQIPYLFPDREDAVQRQCHDQRGLLNGQGFTKHIRLMTVVSIGM